MDAATTIDADRPSAQRITLARLAGCFVVMVQGASIAYTPGSVLA
jgi:hypothetical protein